MYTFNAVRQ